MGQGFFPDNYLQRPVIEKSTHQIFADLEAFTHEISDTQESLFSQIDFTVVLPPLRFDNRFVKGIFYSNATDVLLQTFPALTEAFHSIATSHWVSYPWSIHADAYFTLYPCPEREAWFKKNRPQMADKILIPLDPSDDISSSYFHPTFGGKKDIDLLLVAPPRPVHNLPIVCEALKIYRKKYKELPIQLYWYTGTPIDLNYTGLGKNATSVLRQVEKILIHPAEYVFFQQSTEPMSALFSRAKAVVTPELIGEKGREMHTALACNTPVIGFREFNQYAREETVPVVYEGAGVVSTFHPEALADSIFRVLQEPQRFHPRAAYLEYSGRLNFFNTCIDAFPYYREAIPDYSPATHHESYWLDLALQDNYKCTLYDFYTARERWKMPFLLRGLDNVQQAIDLVFGKYTKTPVLPVS